MTLMLRKMLQDYDLHMLTVIANRWDVDLDSRQQSDVAEQVAQTMLTPTQAEQEWSRLDERERAALQILLGAPERRQTLAKYSRLYGDIRQMGEERREREKPHLNPLGMAEQLFYRGFIGLTFHESPAGMQPYVFVPQDLADLLPVGDNAYSQSNLPPLEDLDEDIQRLQKANTALVDDVASFLAYLQVQDAYPNGQTLVDADRQALADYLLGNADPARIHLIVSVCRELGLCGHDHQGGFLKPIPNKARTWLDEPRTQQMESLVNAWHKTTRYNELLFVPDIELEKAVAPNNPTLMRQMLQTMLKEAAPQEDWFNVDEFIQHIKDQEPDFQRPAGDYESWYIRDVASGEYLRGFEHWDSIEGAMLSLTLTVVLPWLGLVDVAETEHGPALRLSAFGRAYAQDADFPHRPDAETHLYADEDGVFSASRHLSRYDRFQLARFTNWGLPGEPYEYQMSPESLARAADQGIRAEHVRAFLGRTLGDTLPEVVDRQLERWELVGQFTAQLVLRQAMILQSESAEELDTLYETPEIRRFLGERLGERAAVVRGDQWQALVDTLRRLAIPLEQDL